MSADILEYDLLQKRKTPKEEKVGEGGGMKEEGGRG